MTKNRHETKLCRFDLQKFGADVSRIVTFNSLKHRTSNSKPQTTNEMS